MKYSSKAMWLKGFNNIKIHADNCPGEIEAFYIIKIDVSPNYRRILFTGYIERMIVFNRELQGVWLLFIYKNNDTLQVNYDIYVIWKYHMYASLGELYIRIFYVIPPISVCLIGAQDKFWNDPPTDLILFLG